MSAVRKNRIHPAFSQPHSQDTSKRSSIEKLPINLSHSKPRQNTTQPSVFPNPYLKKFNLRKVNRIEDSPGKNLQSSVKREARRQSEAESLEKINESLQVRRSRKISGIRVHTEKVRHASETLKESPYRAKNPLLNTIDHEHILNESKYKHLSVFQRQEIHRYEVLFVGKRRINAAKDFTSSSGDAKVAAHDSIIYRYEVLDILGKGSFGQVFKAYDHKRKQTVALKIIRNEAKFCTQAKVEIRILEEVLMKDPWGKSNIIHMKHAFFFRGHPCLVFELLHQNLYEFLREFNFAGISMELILRFCIQILQGLAFLSKQNIIHCDLKPENILLRQKNKTGIKIIDVGSGCYSHEQIYTYIQSRFYRAPEIILGVPYTTAIDMWSMGCILVELYQGCPLFPGEDEQDQMGMFMELLGVPPGELVERGARSKKFFVDKRPKIKPNKKGVLRHPGSRSIKSLIGEQHEDFVDFLQNCFKWSPEERMTPAAALLHPWILNGLPEEIQKQHRLQVQKQFYL